ncbi:MAG: glycosyltransferase [Rickettsiales bacterium]|jgi:glycosyltransferase involved in cell wall biosynthesis|nr:glycosyltransferase [Rickettsiales bacterium]
MDKIPLRRQKISVIIPVYNAAEYLGRCIDSVLSQTHGDLEIIAVDDGSTDGSSKILESYAAQDGRMRTVRQENAGVSSARNRGLSMADGDWIYFCDADDYFLNSGSLALMLCAATGAGAEVAACGYYSERDGRAHGFSQPLVVIGGEAKMRMIADEGGMCVRFMFRRDLIVRHGLRFEESLSSKEDLLFSVQAVYFANRVAAAPGAMYCYTNTPSSATNRPNPAARRSHERVRELLAVFAQEYGLSGIFEGHQKKTVTKYRLFSRITVMTKVASPNKICYNLLGIIPIMTIR